MKEQKEFPKVLIGSPIYEGKEYCRKEFVANVKKFTYPNKSFVMVDNSKGTSYHAKLRRDGVPAVRVNRGRNSRDALANSMNYLRKRVLEGGYDYLLSLECDLFPREDIIERLLENMEDVELFSLQSGKRVVGAPYHIGEDAQKRLCIFRTVIENGIGGTRPLEPGDEQWFLNGKVHQVHGMGVGCVLIHKSILEKFPFWYSELDDARMAKEVIRKHPDVYFYLDLHNNRIPVYCDTKLYTLHMPSNWKLVKDI